MKFVSKAGICLILFLMGCFKQPDKHVFTPTKFSDDVKNYRFLQLFMHDKGDDFIGIFGRPIPGGLLSSDEIVIKLYSADSISKYELFYQEHPLKVISWEDSIITLKACVGSSDSDSIYMRWYLDNSVDKNQKLGRYTLRYNKNYNCYEWPYF